MILRMAKKTDQDEIHALTTAEISRQSTDVSKEIQSATVELVEIEKARKVGAAEYQPISDHQKAVREYAQSRANGHASTLLKFPPSISREQELRIKIDGLNLLLKALQSAELAARAADAVAWEIENRAKWCALARETVLTAIRLDALENRAKEMRQEAGGMFAARLALCLYVGNWQSIAGFQAEEIAEAALAEGIVTKSEIRAAERGGLDG